MTELTGQTFERYKILERLGEGGMATVYKAYDERLDREVAIKVIRRDAFPADQIDMLLKRFERESKSLAKLSHPNIVGVLDYGEHEGSPYLVMEYLAGGTLKEKLGKPLPWREAVQLTLPISQALEYIHSRNIINRDVKPSNILMTEKGQPMLTDFGLVKIFGEETKENTHLTSSGSGLGTPDYMAPEQWTGETTTQSDLYSLGVVLYEMITGHRPYTADTPAGILLKQATETLPLPKNYIPNLPRNVEAVLLKALAKQPADRYPDMHTFSVELQNLLADKDVLASQTRTEVLRDQMTGRISKKEVAAALPPPNQSKSLFLILGGLGALGIVLLLGGYLYLSNFNSVTPTPTAQLAATSEPNSSATPEVVIVEVTSAPTKTSVPTATSFPTEIKDPKNVTMVYIPPGEFTMGANDSGDVASKPESTVYVDGFYIDKYETTNKEYDACVYAVECRKPLKLGSVTHNTYFGNTVFANYPVIYVDWKMAKMYCEWRGARLPTEAEWEKAARGTEDARIYPWGDAKLDCSFANFHGCIGDTAPVDQYLKGVSVYGVFGLSGNIFEWTSSLALPYPYNATDGREDPDKRGERVARGGSWHAFGGNGENVRLDSRLDLDPAYAGAYVGIRCVISK
ncbi:MAG: SUMF1/EgtB/PvdO family nonheme iron enzyme [Anaerolineales bacterium]|nr:SUMF1/EgtB/PvdO family nonheme iron enzyme [Anaerolineales bacterium]MCZ2122599.1 bifunctional serine/threonine-protein kinase/formylglycine-generating enzyme family protein [Anaerolineales bacterium]